MNVKELYRHQFEMGRLMLTEMLEGMTAAEMVAAPVPGGNFPLWCLGHLTFSEARGLYQWVRGEPNPLESWATVFGQGSTPVEGGRGYPSKEELWSRYQEVRGELLASVDALTEGDLDKPANMDHPLFNTVGRVLGSLALHQGFHLGQIALARKALGKKPALF